MTLSPPIADATAPPFVDGRKVLCNGKVEPWTGPVQEVFAPIYKAAGSEEKVLIGYQARMDEAASLKALDAAVASWSHGRGEWALATPEHRIAKIEELVKELKTVREQIVQVLMWEICKSAADAAKEFDRTMDFIAGTLKEYKAMLKADNAFVQMDGVLAQSRRGPIGVMLNLGPFNYPFNETYCTLIPALLMGNSVVMKLPNVGCLAHICSMETYAKVFPPGVVNFVSGAGRTTMPPIMATGKVDIFAFIGGSKAADALLKIHPEPHRLKASLALDAKNLGVVMPDCDMAATVTEVLAGSLSYNGQRCTALKLLFVHESIADAFLAAYCAKVDELKIGLPWESGVKLTPLPEPNKPAYLRELIADAKSLGAKVVNQLGEQEAGPFVRPTVLYPVSEKMRVWHEEQFGPLVPVVPFRELDDVYAYLAQSTFGQQASVFAGDVVKCAPLLDALANSVGRVNINAQCQRGPDYLPFSGRKSSALGTLSVTEALKTVSTEYVVATKDNAMGKAGMLSLAGAQCNCVASLI
ncbi:glyceraldehyde-3-phosphate dehydrogenase [Emiliania huxleyi CCMP1516]|uniref:Succinate-semialdehyde dehydrogenase, mitochondrial n=2 Tax=Emiliania huxleyi TaxID=2903 RepID=A0A0D3I190_EMIH1|nr:glyceraldehyde-3-phosphate dehydrogenase [Emiliania huxleyi CCMP1516]EOD05025.1 glyceraldehyde-3-phosphate dehydrogenase [Emiliania huxleyi CCMP1516]|eukprot:XP_005757454.1 glyceraldehyde-3-phosphate dehydrogenase [Emiliania huxleyi CCMP1516]